MAQFLQDRAEAGPLVDARRQDHYGPLVEDDLHLQPQIANDLYRGFFVRLPSRDDHRADRHRRDAAAFQLINEYLGGAAASRRISFVSGE